MKHIKGTEFKKEVLSHKGIVLVDFYASWCGPCQVLSPLLESLEKELAEVKFVKVNVDEEQEAASSYSIMSIPTVIIFKDGKVVERLTGALPKEQYKSALSRAKVFDPASVKKEVTVFTTPTCPYCHMVKDYLKEKKQQFKEVDVSADYNSALEMVQKSGQMGVPQLWINGQVIVGFDKRSIDTALEI
jgi:thioredoxin 1